MSPILELTDYHPELESFRREVLHGLSSTPKTLPSKYLYDKRGSELFDEICELDEYYPTRTELAIMEEHVSKMIAHCGEEVRMVEYGSGSSLKTRLLLDAATGHITGYVPVDISKQHLSEAAETIRHMFPDLEILPVCADFTEAIKVPDTSHRSRRTVAYFPGSTIGNFTVPAAIEFLKHVGETVGPEGGLIIGVDLEKSTDILEAAYNDRAGVTAAFNLNLLERINRELDGNFDLDAFTHRAPYNPEHNRIEMHLVSLEDQTVSIGDAEIRFAAGESICTEHSHKYTLDRFQELAGLAGWEVEDWWTDADDLFSIQYLTRTAE